MESLKKYILILFVLASGSLQSKDVVSRVLYFNQLFGHIHKSPSRYSQSLSTIECNHPVKILKDKGGEITRGRYHKVIVGPYTGYIDTIYLSSQKNTCFSNKYPKFYDALKLEISDTFYWGKLNDQYVQGKSQAK